MASYTTETSELKIDTLFVDGDTRTITLKNPKSTIAESEITELNAFIQENNLLVGDKAGGTFGKIKKVVKIRTTKNHRVL